MASTSQTALSSTPIFFPVPSVPVVPSVIGISSSGLLVRASQFEPSFQVFCVYEPSDPQHAQY
jgi:hypothetical protein